MDLYILQQSLETKGSFINDVMSMWGSPSPFMPFSTCVTTTVGYYVKIRAFFYCFQLSKGMHKHAFAGRNTQQKTPNIMEWMFTLWIGF